ncbi:unnamed protein product [Bursaphelenchus okinawaensis]|uniref:Protein kinase domain-containing protein n=1 Tax=Bursaphelenchus okinawaensis TaxID=465554 RepID=A0A811LC57_9BILA|nr:unnamed protein product [Bursaphelenchus okinawaensis]CAG9120450.1 unnamed protein product [Bursaphelenchus okinawaensis]
MSPFLWAILIVLVGTTESTTESENCFLICVAKCLDKDKGIQACGQKCKDYREETLCKTPKCWKKCKDLKDSDESLSSEEKEALTAPFNISATYNRNMYVDINWNAQEDAKIFVVQFKQHSQSQWDVSDQLIVNQNYLSNFSMKDADVCEPLDFRIASVSSKVGIGAFSDPATILPPEPDLSHLTHLSSTYKPPEANTKYPNGTVEIVMAYDSKEWPLGDDDLVVDVNFHNVKCVKPDFLGSENPEFYKGPRPRTLIGVASADYMHRECIFSYGLQKVSSTQCKKTFNFDTTFNIMYINCSNVINSNCALEQKAKGPVCGQIDNFKYKIVNEVATDWSDPSSNITVNVTFEPMQKIKKDVLYFVALYGNAEKYDNMEKATYLGVNLTTEIGRVSNCPVVDVSGSDGKNGRKCVNSTGNSIVIPNLKMDTVYGVMLCGVRDPNNLDFPRLNSPKSVKPKADMIYFNSELYRPSKTWLYIVMGIVAVVAAMALLAYCQCRREKQWKNEKKKLEQSHSAGYSDNRYTDMPKIQDLWELERRNLIIYNDKPLGSGAFGAVFLGKLIGSAKGSKGAQSTLGVNLMRVENCEVAVKMLPEYADHLSKQEFLREIGLMKTLGYHERLVNMLACITDSEPYCLIVEYCSDGDLQRFLKKRCDYMLKLENDGVELDDESVDQELVMTLKQLLMFSVQISYGLEYLSHKGFVHRDVAARNVLVHDKNCAKIGDFGLCRYIYAESAQYKSKGGRLPLKWMSPEAIRHYEFTTKSDVWSFGILMFEIITLGGTPYPGVAPEDMLGFLEDGKRMDKPDNCPDTFYEIMTQCWEQSPENRPSFSDVRQLLAKQLETITDEYSYLKLDAGKDYYQVDYDKNGEPKVETILVSA